MIEVRPAEEHDVDQLIAAETHGPARLHLRERWRKQVEGMAVFLLAHLDGAIVGHALLLRESKYAEMREAYGVPEVNALHAYVEGKGVGTALVAGAEGLARQWGYDAIGLAVEPGNARARRLYERLGYAEKGEVVDEWTEQADDGTVLKEHADACLYLTKRLPMIPPVVPPGRMASHAQPVLSLTNDLELRPWHLEDADALVEASRDPAIRQWNLLQVDSTDDARGRIERMHKRWQAETAAIWAIAPPDGGEARGLIGWTDIDLAGGSAEIVYWVLPAARGAGVVVEATNRVTRWALDELGLHRLRLCHSVANEASCRVAAKTGYVLEGTMRSALLHADGWHDQHLHALIQA